jgi:dTDP-glucose pyrophosphorylase
VKSVKDVILHGSSGIRLRPLTYSGPKQLIPVTNKPVSQYVESMWLMLQQDEPDDCVIATFEAHSVRELAEKAFDIVGLNWEDYVRVDKGV